MRKILLFLLLSTGAGCRNEAVLPNPDSTFLDVMSQPSWRTESLNSDYTIQFPKDKYEGGLAQTIEGPLFDKHRTDQTVRFNGLLGSLGPFPYGEALASPRPASVSVSGRLLDNQIIFSRNGQVQSVFYYDRQPRQYGRLYLLKDGLLKLSLEASYNTDQRAEVLGILQTIQPK